MSLLPKLSTAAKRLLPDIATISCRHRSGRYGSASDSPIAADATSHPLLQIRSERFAPPRGLVCSVCCIEATVCDAIGAAPNSQLKDKFENQSCEGAIVLYTRGNSMRFSTFVRIAVSVAALLPFASLSAPANELRISDPLVYANLAIYVVHDNGGGSAVPLTLEDAIAAGQVKVRETGA